MTLPRRGIHQPTGLTVKVEDQRTKGGQHQYLIRFPGYHTWTAASKVDFLPNMREGA